MAEGEKVHHHVTGDGEDYTLFSVHCVKCEAILFEFVHLQVYVGMAPSDPMYFDPRDRRTSTGYAPAQSWYAAKTKVRCYEMTDGTREHVLSLRKGDEDCNQLMRSRSMSHQQYGEWRWTTLKEVQ